MLSVRVLQSLRCFFIEPANGFFAGDAVYGRSDDAKRFDFFTKVAILTFYLFRNTFYAANIAHSCRAPMHVYAELNLLPSMGTVLHLASIDGSKQ